MRANTGTVPRMSTIGKPKESASIGADEAKASCGSAAAKPYAPTALPRCAGETRSVNAVAPHTVMIPNPTPRRALVTDTIARLGERACKGAGTERNRTPAIRIGVHPNDLSARLTYS